MAKRERRTFTEEFKQQMVQLYQNGKPRKEIIREYDLTPSSLDKWVGQSQTSGPFKEKDNLTDEQKDEFKNKLIDEALETFNIKRSLSMKGCPYDNAVAEATFKIIKTEFVKGQNFDSLEDLTRELHDYVHWFNHIRIHGTLGYLSPIDYKLENPKKSV